MAPVIWGLNLGEIQWSKFKSSYMWNNEYHLRRTKFIVYQCAMIFCVVSESLGTAALSDYIDQQNYIEGHSGRQALEYNNDFIGAASYNIFVGVYVATIFGAGFFFDLFWPERHESKAVRLAWKICSVIASVFALASALTLTIIVARNSARAEPIPGSALMQEDIFRLRDGAGGPSLTYRHNARAVASVVFIWPGMIATIASTILLWKSQVHDDVFGPKSTHERANPAMKNESEDYSPSTTEAAAEMREETSEKAYV